MNKQHVMEQFAALAGLSLQEANVFSSSADIAIASIRASLREDTDPQQHAALLEYLCGAVCFYGYALRADADGTESVRALDFTVTKKGGGLLRAAAALRDEAFALAHSLLRDERFFFGRAG